MSDPTVPFVPTLPIAVTGAREALEDAEAYDFTTATLRTLAAQHGRLSESLRQILGALDAERLEPAAATTDAALS